MIGDGNVFECGCHCESLSVGDENTFEARCNIHFRPSFYVSVYCHKYITAIVGDLYI